LLQEKKGEEKEAKETNTKMAVTQLYYGELKYQF
jgi:hypothetical protein